MIFNSKEQEMEFILSTGTTIESYIGVIGINPNLEIYHDDNGGYGIAIIEDGVYGISSDKLTKEEKIEIAKYAINLWEQYLNKL